MILLTTKLMNPLYELVTITDKFDFSLLEDEKMYPTISKREIHSYRQGDVIKSQSNLFKYVIIPLAEKVKDYQLNVRINQHILDLVKDISKTIWHESRNTNFVNFEDCFNNNGLVNYLRDCLPHQEEKKVSEELISKAEKFDEIEEIVSQAYEEDSDADLVTIGEAVASYLGY